jgi:hypothetical protein
VKAVPTAKKTRNVTTSAARFAEVGCRAIDFRFLVAKDKFKLADFTAAMKCNNQTPARLSVSCATQSPEETDYHTHFAWTEADKKEVELWVSYCVGSVTPRSGETEPYAEQFMGWLGKFFVNGSANAEVQGRFRYSIADRQSRYLLPVKVVIVPGLDTAINGISIDFPSRPNGIDLARLVAGTKNLTVFLGGTAKVRFDQFDVYEHLHNLSELAQALTDSRKP